MPESATSLHLPRQWPQLAADALAHAVAMARVAIVQVHGGLAGSPIARVRLRCDNERLRAELARVGEVMRIKDARLDACLRATARATCLTSATHHALRAAAGWSAAETARVFLVLERVSGLELVVNSVEGREHLPIIELKRAA